MNRVKVLYIDDEVNNLYAFKACFRRDFEVNIASSSTEAMNFLSTNQVDVIISDQKMPDKTGVEFFESILEEYPDPIRILLTGYSDIEAVISAINKGKIYSYITKPWNEFDLRQIIIHASSLHQLREENRLLNGRYQKVFSESSDFILIFDEKGNVLDCNHAASKKIGCKNKNIKSFIDNDEDFDFLISKLLSSGSISDFECVFIDIEGKQLNGLLSGGINTSESNESKNFQVIVKDITERKLLDRYVFRKTIEAQENERRRVADDLHDSLGQELSSVKMMLGVMKDGNLSNDKWMEISTDCYKILDGSIKELRNICFNLMPSALEKGGFIPAFQQMVRPLNIKVEWDFGIKQLPLTQEQQIALYRVSQEFVHNTLKHSQASVLKLGINLIKNKINIEFQDNGIGFDLKDISSQNQRGHNTMLKRIESYGGKAFLISNIGEGTKLKIQFV